MGDLIKKAVTVFAALAIDCSIAIGGYHTASYAYNRCCVLRGTPQYEQSEMDRIEKGLRKCEQKIAENKSTRDDLQKRLGERLKQAPF